MLLVAQYLFIDTNQKSFKDFILMKLVIFFIFTLLKVIR